jgi:hypothetical protein
VQHHAGVLGFMGFLGGDNAYCLQCCKRGPVRDRCHEYMASQVASMACCLMFLLTMPST